MSALHHVLLRAAAGESLMLTTVASACAVILTGRAFAIVVR
jgi:hypothetical protein